MTRLKKTVKTVKMTDDVTPQRVKRLLRKMQNHWQRDAALTEMVEIGPPAAAWLGKFINSKDHATHAAHALALLSIATQHDDVKDAIAHVYTHGSPQAVAAMRTMHHALRLMALQQSQ